jgi:hypothetical protein
MSYVLAIEPDAPQAEILRGDIGATARTKVKVVTTLDAAMAAIDNEVPKVVLLNPLMRPADENQLIGRLRRLPHAIAPQVLMTPPLGQLAPLPAQGSSTLRLFERFRKTPFRPAPCDPAVFARQLCEYMGDPDRVGADRRAAKRIEGIDWARLRLNDAAADLIDLSLVGAQVRAPILLPEGSSVRLLLSREAETDDVLQCEAAVIWGVSDDAAPTQAARYRAGIRFKNIDHQLLDRMCFGNRGLSVRPNER